MSVTFDDGPRCDKCGVELTTGLMAVFCPKEADCEFWPDTPEGVKFIRQLRAPTPRAGSND